MKRVKYPRTYHLPWSEGVGSDDKMLKHIDNFAGKRVIVTEKMDGENTTMYHDYIHARGINGNNHPSRDWVKQFWGGIKNNIPENMRICGENLYAKHSIYYSSLPTYFMGFSAWDNDNNVCLSWDETEEWFELLEITPVPVLYDGIFDIDVIKGLWDGKKRHACEGYVVRVADSFAYSDFQKSVAKFVRKDHVQTDKHWMNGSLEKNEVMNVEYVEVYYC